MEYSKEFLPAMLPLMPYISRTKVPLNFKLKVQDTDEITKNDSSLKRANMVDFDVVNVPVDPPA